MKMYRNTNPSGGLSVAFTVKFGVDTYIMYCTKEMEIGFRKGDFPNKINGNHSDIIFYQKDASEGHKTFTFESAQQTKGYFLASLEKDGKHKLGLKRPVDTPDETTFIGLNILNKK
ncbi:interleukin-18 [Rhinophrynus dorsalis]